MSPFVEFDNKRVASLANEPWQTCEDPDGTIWLFKFHASAELGCCFLITDNVHVWGEALEVRHFLRRRAKRHGAGNEDDLQDHEGPEWRDARVRDLVCLHAQSAVAGDSVEFSTERDTLNADLEVNIASPSCSWKWETISLGPKLGPQIISKQLLLPLITFSEFALKASQPLGQTDEASWTKQLDVTAKTGRVVNLTQVLFRKPLVTSSLARISQISSRAIAPTPVVSTFVKPPLDVDLQRLEPQLDDFAARIQSGIDASSKPEKARGMFEERDAPMRAYDKNSPARSTRGSANDHSLPSDIESSTPSKRIDSFRRSLENDGPRTFPVSETLSDGEETETDNEGLRPSHAKANHNQPSVTAKPPHEESDGSGSGTDSESSLPKPKSKPAPKRKVSSDEDEPKHSDKGTNPKVARSGGAGWQGPRKAVARKKKF